MQKYTVPTVAAANERMERLRIAKEKLTLEVEQIMNHSEEEQLTWTATKTDLMEALYYAYNQMTIIDEYGVPLTFRCIVERCCRVLHTKVPNNPYGMAEKGQNRKGVKSVNFMKRYLRMSERKTMENALWSIISKPLS